MATTKTDILRIAKNFIKAVEKGKTGEALDKFYHKDVEHTTYPNVLTRNITKRNLKELKEASERGKGIFTKQTYSIIKTYVYGNKVVIEALWTGTLRIGIGKLPIGGKMKAHFAQFFEFKRGKIFRQRNYDCFEPFD